MTRWFRGGRGVCGAVALAMLAGGFVCARAQTAHEATRRLRFEVASVRENKAGGPGNFSVDPTPSDL